MTRSPIELSWTAKNYRRLGARKCRQEAQRTLDQPMQKSGGAEFIISRTSQVLARKPSRTKRVAEDLMRWVRWATLAADGLLQGLSVHKKEGGGPAPSSSSPRWSAPSSSSPGWSSATAAARLSVQDHLLCPNKNWMKNIKNISTDRKLTANFLCLRVTNQFSPKFRYTKYHNCVVRFLAWTLNVTNVQNMH